MNVRTPNMKLRMPGKDYTDPGYYFCTLVVEGRRHLFGSVIPAPCAEQQGELGCNGTNVPRSQSTPHGHSTPHEGACIAYSPYGQLITRELRKIGTEGQYAGKVEIKGKVIMPDHIHLLVFIKERLPKALGYVINGFIVGCRRQWKQLCGIRLKQTVPVPLYEQCKEEVRTGCWNLPAGQKTWPKEQPDGILRIFEKGYNDNVVYRRGQLDGYYKYIAANPRRWLLRERYPNLFCKVWGKELLPGHRFDMIGNMFLLDRPWKVPMRISRFSVEEEAFDPYNPEKSFVQMGNQRVLRHARYVSPRREKTAEEIKAAIEMYLSLARAGAVLVTPCISPAELQVVQVAYKEGLPVVMLSFKGFSRYYHPSKAHYDACAGGLLLQLAPWRYDPSREMRKQLCEELNDMAMRLADLCL